MAAVEPPKYEELCRLCATKTTMVLAINIFENEGTIRQISKKICTCLPIQVHETDELPKMICENCLYKLELLCDFRERSARTEKLLIELYKELNSAQSQSDQQQSCMVSMDQNDLMMVQHHHLLNDHNLPSVSHLDLSHLGQREGMIVEHEIILTQHSVDMNSHSLDSIDLNNHDLTNQDLSNQSLQTQDSLMVDSNTQSIQDSQFADDNLNLIQQQQILSDQFRVQHDLQVEMREESSGGDIQLTNEMKQQLQQESHNYHLQAKMESCHDINDVELDESKLENNSYSANTHIPVYNIYERKENFKMDSMKQEDSNSEYTLLVDEHLNNARVPNLVNEKQVYNLNIENTDSLKYSSNKMKDCFYCNICGKSYEQKVEFEAHYETHFNKCSICFAVFTNLDVLNAHRKEAHGDCTDNQKLSTSTENTEIKQEEIVIPFKLEDDDCEEEFSNDINTDDESHGNTKCDDINEDISSEKNRRKRERDHCLFCKNDVLNFARHMQRKHSLEEAVKKVSSYPLNSRKRKELVAALRKKGNYIKYLHNEENIRYKKCQLPHTKLLPCNFCFGFYSSKGLWRHKKKCSEKKESRFSRLIENVITKHAKGTEQLRDIVFPKMREDSISFQVKKDALICEFGAKCLAMRKDPELDALITSRKMRELARLLIAVKRLEPGVKTLFEVLQPKYFDTIVQATKTAAKFDTVKCMYTSPTYALNLGNSLKQCCDIALTSLVEKKGVYATDNSSESELNLIKMIELFGGVWKNNISKQASDDLQIKKGNKLTLISLANDVKLLNKYLSAVASNACLKLLQNLSDAEAYGNLLETVFCRIIILNREMPSEFQNLSVSAYEDACKNNQDVSVITSTTENILMKKYNSISLTDKQGNTVPILLSSRIQAHIKLLIDIRSNFFNKENEYLFIKPNKNNVICGNKTLEKYVKLCGAKNSLALTSSSLRKHVITITQILNMTESDIKQLADYVGQNLSVNKNTYNISDDVFQAAKMTQTLLLMKRDPSTYKTKSDEDINLSLKKELEVVYMEDQKIKDFKNEVKRRISKNKRRIHVPWTREQKEIVYKFFKEHIKDKKPPRKQECDELMKNYPLQFKNKSWPKIKVFVQNVYTNKLKLRLY